MNIKTWIKYEESYLPPRCRKLRYRECEDHIDVKLREVKSPIGTENMADGK